MGNPARVSGVVLAVLLALTPGVAATAAGSPPDPGSPDPVTLVPVGGEVAFSNVPDVLPWEAQYGDAMYPASLSSEVGTMMTFAAGTPRLLSRISFVLANWRCEFGHAGEAGVDCLTPSEGDGYGVRVTVTVRAVSLIDGRPVLGETLVTKTETLDMLYRRSQDDWCEDGQYFDPAIGHCRYDEKHLVTFFPDPVLLPETVVVSVGYTGADYLRVTGTPSGTEARVGSAVGTGTWFWANPEQVVWSQGPFRRPMFEVRTGYDVTLTGPNVSSPVWALGEVTATLGMEGSHVPAGASVGVVAYDGPGAETCSSVAVAGSWLLPVDDGELVRTPGYTPAGVGPVAYQATLLAADGRALLVSQCVTTSAKAFFADVGPGHPFFGPIQRMGVSGLSRGYGSPPEFRPAAAQERQAMAVFVQRALGEEAPACTGAPFTDIPVSHPFCAEIAWLKEEGLTGGYADGTFAPTRTGTRQDGAAFLARMVGEVPACERDAFRDVPKTHPFCAEIQWLVDQGVSSGFGDGTFRPNAPLERQAMAVWMDGLTLG